jgi:hypothetical protein
MFHRTTSSHLAVRAAMIDHSLSTAVSRQLPAEFGMSWLTPVNRAPFSATGPSSHSTYLQGT